MTYIVKKYCLLRMTGFCSAFVLSILFTIKSYATIPAQCQAKVEMIKNIHQRLYNLVKNKSSNQTYGVYTLPSGANIQTIKDDMLKGKRPALKKAPVHYRGVGAETLDSKIKTRFHTKGGKTGVKLMGVNESTLSTRPGRDGRYVIPDWSPDMVTIEWCDPSCHCFFFYPFYVVKLKNPTNFKTIDLLGQANILNKQYQRKLSRVTTKIRKLKSKIKRLKLKAKTSQLRRQLRKQRRKARAINKALTKIANVQGYLFKKVVVRSSDYDKSIEFSRVLYMLQTYGQ